MNRAFTVANMHKTVFMPELNNGQGAEIDCDVRSLIESLNSIGLVTVSSCQGSPGVIGEGGFYGHVAFIHGDSNGVNHEPVCKYTFTLLRGMFSHMYDDVRLEVTLNEGTGFYGWIHFRNEALEEVSKRLGVYCDMRHK